MLNCQRVVFACNFATNMSDLDVVFVGYMLHMPLHDCFILVQNQSPVCHAPEAFFSAVERLLLVQTFSPRKSQPSPCKPSISLW